MKNSLSRKKVKVAVFDIDGTIFRSSLLIELFNELVATGIFPAIAARQVSRDYEAWLNRKGHYNDYLMKLVAVHYKYLNGCKVVDIEKAIRRVLAQQANRTYRFTRDLIASLRKQHYHLLAISNSQDSIVQQFARHHAFDGAIGRVLEVKSGRYTGRMAIPLNEHMDKPGVLQTYLKEHGLQADLRQSVVVGDTEGDLSLLRIVGHPIAFNPSQPLVRVAQRHGWDIVVERKDVMYRIRDAQLVGKPERPRGTFGHQRSPKSR